MYDYDYDVKVTACGVRLTLVEVLIELAAVVAILSLFAWGAP